jgi:hypothetical protein
MIKSLRCKDTDRLFQDGPVSPFRIIERVVRRKLKPNTRGKFLQEEFMLPWASARTNKLAIWMCLLLESMILSISDEELTPPLPLDFENILKLIPNFG